MKKNYYKHLNRMYVKYARLIKNLQKSINSGRFANYAKEKQTQFLKILSNYESQLKKAGFVIGTSLALMMPPSTAYAQPAKLGNEIKVNTSISDQASFPGVAVDDDGDFAVTWIHHDTTSSLYNVYLQRYDNTGTRQGGEVKVNNNSSLYFNLPEIVMDDDGDFAVIWKGYDLINGTLGVFMQRYDNNGVAQGGETPVNTATIPADVIVTSAAMDNDGDMVVAWAAIDTATGDNDLYIQRFDNTGAKQGVETKVNVNSEEVEMTDIAMDDDGDIVVTWTAYDNTLSQYGVYMQRYDNTGVAQGVETKVNTSTNNYFLLPSVAMDAHGDYVVAWTEEDNNEYSVQIQRYNPNGVAQGTQTKVNPTGTTGLSVDQGVAMDETGNFVVVWNTDNGNYYDIYGQAYQSTGAAIGSPFLVIGNADLLSRGLSMQADGDFIVSYSNTVNSEYDVYVQRYTGGLPTNINNQALDNELTIYPNPVENELFLEASIQGIVKVYNMLGQSIKEISLNNSTISIDVSDLPTGQYLLEVVSEAGQRATKKFIKK